MQLKNFIAGCFAVVGFVASLLSGLYVDNPAASILSRALVSLVACYAVGYIMGMAAQVLAKEHAQRIAVKVAQMDAAAAAQLAQAAQQSAAESAAAAQTLAHPAPQAA